MAVALADEHHLEKSCATAFYTLNKAYRVRFYNILETPYGSDSFPHRHPASIRSLSPRLLQQFTHGREFIRCIGLDLFCNILPHQVTKFRYTDPAAHKRCKKALRPWWEMKFADASQRLDGLYSNDPLGLADAMIETLDVSQTENEEICKYCRGQLQWCLRATRRYIWDRLCDYFEVPDPLNLEADITGEYLDQSFAEVSIYRGGLHTGWID